MTKKGRGRVKTSNYKEHHLAHMRQKYRDTHYMNKIGRNGNWQQIQPMLHTCEIRFDSCVGIAYRKVSSRLGDRWTCDGCAKELCLESEEYFLNHLTLQKSWI
jgi:hypothetical protein